VHEPRRYVLGLALGGLVAVLDTTVAVVAAPALAEIFGVPLATMQWTTTAYVLGYIATLPLAAWLSQRVGARRAYVAALLVFAAATGVTAAATGPAMLIAARAVQGLAGGPLNPLAMTLALRGLAPERRGRVASTLGLPVLVGPLLGPILGGALLDSVSWRGVFLVVLPPALVAAWVVARWAPPDPPRHAAPLDLTGTLLLVPGAVGIVYALSADGVDRAARVAGLLGGLAVLGGFGWRSVRRDHPLLRVGLLADRRLLAGIAVLMPFGAAYFGSMLLGPTYVQITRGDPAAVAGALAIPAGLATGLTLQVATRMVDRLPPRRIVLIGLLLGSAGFAAYAAVLTTHTSYLLLGGLGALIGVGSGAVLMPTMTAATRHFDGAELASASTLMGLLQQLAVAVGTAGITGMFTALAPLDSAPGELVTAHRLTLLLPLGLTLAAATVAVNLDRTSPTARRKDQEHEHSGLGAPALERGRGRAGG
jgi:EmrB/QacA subfamily drug resistance transporter